jgi:GH15 family glucan-1,4-alpha-glucosidase
MMDENEKPLRIEDYALIGDCLTGALVGRNGSIDWLCWPRFDSDACFAALLGTSHNGRWRIAPADGSAKVSRSYRDCTMILETVFDTAEGQVALIDFMPVGRPESSVVRRVEGRRGTVAMHMQMLLRFGYGTAIPWVTQLDDGRGIKAVAGPDQVVLRALVELKGADKSTVADFTVAAGNCVDFVLTWNPSHLPPTLAFDSETALQETEAFWREWSGRCTYQGTYRETVLRSLVTLKALTFVPTGGIVAAPTTSLPEQPGGPRNWDYRFCWLRDATLTLVALMEGGYYKEAQAWREWLHRAVAGNPDDLQIMYGIAGERRLLEWTAAWLPGYEDSAPVRVGNAASEQLQLDTYGELMGAISLARRGGLAEHPSAWSMQSLFIEHLAGIWDQPDDGIWEVRGGRRHFTHSKVMAWLAVHRSVKDAETYGLDAPLDRWRALRDRMHTEICEKGFDRELNSFTQSFGSKQLDASLLLIPMVGFLPIDDPRVEGTIAAIEQALVVDGFVLRYRTEAGADGLPAGEGAFLPCSFWLADAYGMQGRTDEAVALFERLIGLANDVGLLAEEYDPRVKRQVGNFPQAFSHLALINAVLNMHGIGSVEKHRAA